MKDSQAGLKFSTSPEKCFRAFGEVFAHNVGRRRITSLLLFFTGWRELKAPLPFFRVVLAASFILRFVVRKGNQREGDQSGISQ